MNTLHLKAFDQLLFHKGDVMIKIIEYKKEESRGLDGEILHWSVEIRVDRLFHINFPIPLKIKPANFQAYLDENYNQVLRACKHIYRPIFSLRSAQVERHVAIKGMRSLDMKKLQEVLRRAAIIVDDSDIEKGE